MRHILIILAVCKPCMCAFTKQLDESPAVDVQATTVTATFTESEYENTFEQASADPACTERKDVVSHREKSPDTPNLLHRLLRIIRLRRCLVALFADVFSAPSGKPKLAASDRAAILSKMTPDILNSGETMKLCELMHGLCTEAQGMRNLPNTLAYILTVLCNRWPSLTKTEQERFLRTTTVCDINHMFRQVAPKFAYADFAFTRETYDHCLKTLHNKPDEFSMLFANCVRETNINCAIALGLLLAQESFDLHIHSMIILIYSVNSAIRDISSTFSLDAAFNYLLIYHTAWMAPLLFESPSPRSSPSPPSSSSSSLPPPQQLGPLPNVPECIIARARCGMHDILTRMLPDRALLIGLLLKLEHPITDLPAALTTTRVRLVCNAWRCAQLSHLLSPSPGVAPSPVTDDAVSRPLIPLNSLPLLRFAQYKRFVQMISTCFECNEFRKIALYDLECGLAYLAPGASLYTFQQSVLASQTEEARLKLIELLLKQARHFPPTCHTTPLLSLVLLDLIPYLTDGQCEKYPPCFASVLNKAQTLPEKNKAIAINKDYPFSVALLPYLLLNEPSLADYILCNASRMALLPSALADGAYCQLFCSALRRMSPLNKRVDVLMELPELALTYVRHFTAGILNIRYQGLFRCLPSKVIFIARSITSLEEEVGDYPYRALARALKYLPKIDLVPTAELYFDSEDAVSSLADEDDLGMLSDISEGGESEYASDRGDEDSGCTADSDTVPANEDVTIEFFV